MIARLTLLLVALGIAVLVAGCGGGGDESESSATTVSTSSLNKAQFVKKANAICERGRKKFLNYLSHEVNFPEAIEVSIVPAFEGIVEQVRDVGAPKGDAAQIEAFLGSMQSGSDTLTEKRFSIKALPEIEPPFEGSARLARQYGIRRCVFAF